VCVGVVLIAVVAVLTVRLFGRELLKPGFKILMKTGLVVFDEDAGG
jgi:hypothetical protein